MSDLLQQSAVILASASANRRQLLASTGLQFDIHPANIDETQLKETYTDESPVELGMRLAKAKALTVSQCFPDAYIIGADQICACGNQVFDKPMSAEQAVQQLLTLQGKTHQQICAMAIAHQNTLIWAYQDIATLTMKSLSESTLRAYVARDNPLYSCGAYHFEQSGKWLFDTVEGSESSIQGLALMPLINALCQLKVVDFAI